MAKQTPPPSPPVAPPPGVPAPGAPPGDLPPPPVPAPPHEAAPPTAPRDGSVVPLQDDRSIGDLLKELTDESTTLVRQELALAKTEIRQEIKTVGKNVGELVVGAAAAYAGLITLLVGLGWALGELLGGAEWLGLILVGLAVIAISAFLVTKALKTLREMDPAPERTIQSLKEDKQWLKNETP